ncbi:MAG: putative tricarboxylic transport membrane protein [Alphaproteobacteria bacterium]
MWRRPSYSGPGEAAILDVLFESLIRLVSGWHLFYLVLGVYLGLALGILPGLGGSAGLAILLPFVFGMEPSQALAMMIGLQSVTTTSDTFPAVLMGIPGTAGSQATVVDGFPMSKKGEAARALGAAFSASLFGGVFGAIVLTFAIFAAMPILLAVGFGEQMMMIVLALSMVGMLTGSSAMKGLATCCLGMMLGAVGSTPATGVERLTFDTVYLSDHVPLIIVGLAMFGLPEVVDLLRRHQTISKTGVLGKGWMEGLKDTFRHWWIVLRCAVIGTIVGALPGLGGAVVDWIAYSHVIQTSKNKETFGTGDVRGVLAPEAANNAKEGGALIPTLLFGIPGSGSMALLLGGFILIGIEPGIEMVTEHLDLTYIMIWSVAIGNIIGAGTCLLLARPISLLTTIKYAIIAPFMFGLIFFAAFQATRDWGDLIALMTLGTLGVYMKRFGWPRPALLIGYVLSGKVEAAIYHTTQIYGFSFLSRPLVIVFIVLTLFSIYAALRFKVHGTEVTETGVHSPHNRTPQIAFYALVLAVPLFVLYESLKWQYATALYPRIALAIMLVLLVPIGIGLWRQKKPDTIFYDLEREIAVQGGAKYSSEHYLMWLLGMMGIAALFGFVIAVAIFIFTFLRVKARLSYGGCTLGAFLFVALLQIMSFFLTLEYPQGIYQPNIPLPW